MKVLIAALAIGFPIAVVLVWAFEPRWDPLRENAHLKALLTKYSAQGEAAAP